ncbi:MAG: hypothetical protein WB729_21525 [Candidatus Sulfotelmatobacter sp.]
MFHKSVFHEFMLPNILCWGRMRPGAEVWVALMLSSSMLFAQHGGHGAGGSAGGGGMSSIGKPTGVDQKDDLKDFHEALAVQATSQQITQYAAMVKSTAAASTELQSLIGQLQKKDSASALASRGTTFQQALEKARTENKNFLGGFSGPQKSGLKEIAKKLTKEDAELAQRGQELNERVADTKDAGEAIASSAQNLDRALTSFQEQQASLGQEMGIVNPENAGLIFHIAPVRSSINFKSQLVTIVTSGMISQGSAGHVFAVTLTEDVFDLQQNITEVLRTQLNKSDRCGERVAIQDATLTPAQPASIVATRLHFERWACLGRDNNEMAEGDGTLEVKLTPEVDETGTLRLKPVISRIDAEGLLGESLRSGSLGSDLRDKIAETILSAVRQGGDFKQLLPPAAQGSAALHHARFQSTGAGALTVVLDAEIKVPEEKAPSLASELKERSSPQQTPPPQSVPR